MLRIDPAVISAEVHNVIRLARAKHGHPLYKADWRVTQATADLAISVILSGQHVLIEPDHVRINGGHPLALVNMRPGIWGEDEPLPAFSNHPPAPPKA